MSAATRDRPAGRGEAERGTGTALAGGEKFKMFDQDVYN
jgi:hypothetical protein